jgi:hypothetical protein
MNVRWLLLSAVLLTSCAQDVGRASRATIAKLQRSAVAADPKEFPKGEIKLIYDWKLRPGSLVRVPLQTPLGIPSTNGYINGNALPLILDTGNAFPVLLDADSALDVELPSIRGASAKGTGIGGHVDVMLARYTSLHLEDRQILGRGLAGVFLHSYRKTFAGFTTESIPLNLLGLPLLQQFSSVTIDAPKEEILFAYHRPFQPPPRAASFPFTIAEGRMWVSLKIGAQTVRAFFDTGCGSGLRIPQLVLDTIPQTSVSTPRLIKRKAMGVGGIEVEHVGLLKEAYLGNVRLTPLEFDTSSGSREALLGWGPFRRHRITLDFEKSRVWVEPAAP